MTIVVPRSALILLVGPSSSGKTTFAKHWFPEHIVIRSEEFRTRVCNDENLMSATQDAFDVMALLTEKRMARRLLTVVDAINITPKFRAFFLQPARRYSVPAFAIRMFTPLSVCEARHACRDDRPWSVEILRKQYETFHQASVELPNEGVLKVFDVLPDAKLKVEFE